MHHLHQARGSRYREASQASFPYSIGPLPLQCDELSIGSIIANAENVHDMYGAESSESDHPH